MHEANKILFLEKATAFGLIAFFLFSVTSAKTEERPYEKSSLKQVSAPILRAIKEAESLSLNKERLLACTALIRNLKKASPSDVKVLKEKLHQLARVFYSDRGFRDFLAGKELLIQRRYLDAREKLQEAEDAENDNIEILDHLILTYVALNKIDLAEITYKKAIQIYPLDLEIQRDALLLAVAQKNWQRAVDLAEELSKETNAFTVVTLKNWGQAYLKLDQKEKAREKLDAALKKDTKFQETYYWLSLVVPEADARKFLIKYLSLCKDKVSKAYVRELDLCIHVSGAEKKVAL